MKVFLGRQELCCGKEMEYRVKLEDLTPLLELRENCWSWVREDHRHMPATGPEAQETPTHSSESITCLQ